MKQLDDNIGVVFSKLEAIGQMDNTASTAKTKQTSDHSADLADSIVR